MKTLNGSQLTGSAAGGNVGAPIAAAAHPSVRQRGGCLKKSSNLLFVVLICSATLVGCNASSKFKINDCLIPKLANSPEKIVRVVAAGDDEYKFFTHFLVKGALVQAQDYQSGARQEVDKNYIKVECPEFNETFSPNKYLNKKNLR